MRGNLGWIAVAGFAAAALFLGGAWYLSGGRGWGGAPFARFAACGDALSGHEASREAAWDGGERVAIDVPATVRYSPGKDEPGKGGTVKITGDAALISHVRVENGEIGLDCRLGRVKPSLDITLPGRSFRTFSLAGLTSLILSDIDQSELNINLAGSSTVAASGKADSLSVNAAGLSDARLGALSVANAELNLVGKSSVEVAAKDNLQINSVGYTTVTLASEPGHVQTNIVGSGHVIHKAL